MDTFSRTFKDCHGPVATMLLVCFWKSCFVNIVLWSMETQQLDAGCSNFSCRQHTSHTITTIAIYYIHSYSLVPTEDTKTVQYATDINCTMLVMNMMPVSADVHLPSVLWHCRLGVKIECRSVGVVICLEWGADCLHMISRCIPKPHHLLPY